MARAYSTLCVWPARTQVHFNILIVASDLSYTPFPLAHKASLYPNLSTIQTKAHCTNDPTHTPPPSSLVYNRRVDRFEDREGVRVEVAGFGGTEAVEYMGLSNMFPYLTTFVEYFVDRGYIRGKSIRTAPYDWRLAAGLSLGGCVTKTYEI